MKINLYIRLKNEMKNIKIKKHDNGIIHGSHIAYKA